MPGAELAKHIRPDGTLPFLFDGLRVPVPLPPLAGACCGWWTGRAAWARSARRWRGACRRMRLARAWRDTYGPLSALNRLLLAPAPEPGWTAVDRDLRRRRAARRPPSAHHAKARVEAAFALRRPRGATTCRPAPSDATVPSEASVMARHAAGPGRRRPRASGWRRRAPTRCPPPSPARGCLAARPRTGAGRQQRLPPAPLPHAAVAGGRAGHVLPTAEGRRPPLVLARTGGCGPAVRRRGNGVPAPARPAPVAALRGFSRVAGYRPAASPRPGPGRAATDMAAESRSGTGRFRVRPGGSRSGKRLRQYRERSAADSDFP